LKITVITVTYNSEEFLEDCLNSVKNQDYNFVEHIVIDGGSTDGTLSKLKLKQNQFKVIVSEPDNGVYDAMNKGIRLATGDVICFLNSHDFYLSDKILSKVAKIFKENSDIDSCYADIVYSDRKNTSMISRYWKSSTFKPGSFSKSWSPPHQTFFVRSSIYKNLGGFDLNYPLAADNDLMMRFLEVNGIKSIHIPEYWVNMRLGGISNKNLKNIIKQNLEIINALRKNGLSSNPLIFFTYKFISRLKQYLRR